MFPFESTWPLSSKRDKENGTTWLEWEGENSTLTYSWWDSYVFPHGWIIKLLLAGETLNIFLLTGISNIYIFFINKNMNAVVYTKFMIFWLLQTVQATLNKIENSITYFCLMKNQKKKISNWYGRGCLHSLWSWTEKSFSSPPPLPDMEKLQNLFLWWGLQPKNLHMSVDAVVVLELLATTLADKHMATVLSDCMLVRCL